MSGDGKFHFAIDRGGTFTDVYCVLPNGDELVTKLLSQDPDNYPDAPTEGIRRVLHEHGSRDYNYSRGRLVETEEIGSIRMGTTVATNALLERKGERMALCITKGFQHLLQIGNQSRPDIFDLTCAKPDLLYETVLEIDERIMLRTHITTNNNHDPKNNTKNESCNHDEYVAGEGEVVKGVTGDELVICQVPNLQEIKVQLLKLAEEGIKSIAIVFMHSYLYPKHEEMIATLARSLDVFTHVSTSNSVMNMIRMVPRGHTASAAAYLTPVLTTYLQTFQKGFTSLDKMRVDFMKSDGGLTPMNDFGGQDAILSGPAGGVIGYSQTSYKKGGLAVIGLDMGGTSTDVSRYDGVLDLVLETTTAGVMVQAPQLDISTVAAGGGSCLSINKSGMLVVGPESAGAHPGPICYRKVGGKLAVTDANVVLGRVLPKQFPNMFGPNEDEPLDVVGPYEAFDALLKTQQNSSTIETVEELAFGFLQVANESMCRPIRNVTQNKGHDITQHILATFGGAGPQHACAIAASLGMKHVHIHKYGGILSAYGLSKATVMTEEQEPTNLLFQKVNSKDDPTFEFRKVKFQQLKEQLVQKLQHQGYTFDVTTDVEFQEYCHLRYQGTDTSLMVTTTADDDKSLADTFEEMYRREFGFSWTNHKDILMDTIRLRAVLHTSNRSSADEDEFELVTPPALATTTNKTKTYFEGGWQIIPFFYLHELQPGNVIDGPAIIIQSISTIVIEPNCTAHITKHGNISIDINTNNDGASAKHEENPDSTEKPIECDAIQLSLFSHRFMGIAEQMGRTLQRTAMSVNMKERLDFSCALFTADGGLVANAPHIPVHLGAMQAAVQSQLRLCPTISEGDVLVSNHPQLAGGSHLPDITVITPVFLHGKLVFFVASRGHHSDIGGMTPGSMPPSSQYLHQEGARIISFKLVENGMFQLDGIKELLKGSRNLQDNISDLKAQVAANQCGIRLLVQLTNEYSLSTVTSYMIFIQQNAEYAVRDMLQSYCHINKCTTKLYARDYMDDGTPIVLTITIDKKTGDAKFDFTGTGKQVLANHNAPPAVTYSAVIYALRCLVGDDIPLNQGCLSPISFVLPENGLLNPSADAAVVGGNVLTSQRIVDVVLKAFGACAASQGCMNNVTFGNDKFGYYETIAGGAGAGPTWHGVSGIHTHCTNTRITDPEILELRYPILLRKFTLRPTESGGKGQFRGGRGIVREYEPLQTLTMSILSERRLPINPPYGMQGGHPGQCGQNIIITSSGVAMHLGGRCSTTLQPHERLRIETPGGGGYGTPPDDVETE